VRTIVYLHGFISAPQSHKATVLGDYVRGCVTGLEYVVPALHYAPARALAQVEDLFDSSRIAERSHRSVTDWVAAFDRKRAEIRQRRCDAGT